MDVKSFLSPSEESESCGVNNVLVQLVQLVILKYEFNTSKLSILDWIGWFYIQTCTQDTRQVKINIGPFCHLKIITFFNSVISFVLFNLQTYNLQTCFNFLLFVYCPN